MSTFIFIVLAVIVVGVAWLVSFVISDPEMVTKGFGKVVIDTTKLGTKHDYTKMYWGHNIKVISTELVDVIANGEECKFNQTNGYIFSMFPIRVGDVIYRNYQSGKVGACYVSKIHRCSDPNDMYEISYIHFGYRN